MEYYRDRVVNIMMGWSGITKYSEGHKLILGIYNDFKPLARGYKVKEDDAYCATTVSAAFIKAGYADIFPLECGCHEMIQKAKKMPGGSIWIPDKNHVPKLGEVIQYDWNGDGVADHTGIVVQVTGKTFVVMEGNYKVNGVSGVNPRQLTVGDSRIMGYISPKFTANAAPAPAVNDPDDYYCKSMIGTYMINTSEINIRIKPGTENKSIGTAKQFEKVTCDGYCRWHNTALWLKVTTSTGKTGYISCGQKGGYLVRA